MSRQQTHKTFLRSFAHPVCILATLLLSISGCSFGGKGRPLAELSSQGASDPEYLVNPGDSLSVKVWGEPRLTGEVYVREKDGRFTMALIDDVPAAGKSCQQIAADVTKSLEKFIRDASVTVSVVQTAPIRYYLAGKFAKPGEYRSTGEITLIQAVATGGGFLPFSDESSISLIRRAPEGEIRYHLDYNRVLDGREPNPILKNGDVININ